MNPKITIYDAETSETIQREMTDDEIAANGWTPEPEPTPEEETPEE